LSRGHRNSSPFFRAREIKQVLRDLKSGFASPASPPIIVLHRLRPPPSRMPPRTFLSCPTTPSSPLYPSGSARPVWPVIFSSASHRAPEGSNFPPPQSFVSLCWVGSGSAEVATLYESRDPESHTRLDDPPKDEPTRRISDAQFFFSKSVTFLEGYSLFGG